MNLMVYLLLTTALLAAELLYLRVARYYSIVDKPNERSSHTGLTTIRGGGMLFWVAALGAFFYSGFVYPYFFLGLSLVAAVSFFDDLRPLPNRYRIGIQFVAVGLLLRQTGVFPDTVWMMGLSLIIGVGILNAYNFMDGINGITAFYSLVAVGTLWYWHGQQPIDSAGLAISGALLPFTFVALLIFSYFNARRQAVCFAGDVGSVSVACIILYALLPMIRQGETYLPVLFLAVYGVDSILTIIHRLALGQNIFQAHRLHLFQLLVHKGRWPHLRVSAVYGLVQLVINGLILPALTWSAGAQAALAGAILGSLAVTYVILKRRLMHSRV
ncbi:hypothetical protein HNV11_18165 [Spirosoma taeanense]|uniref:UDP-N-acetylmuramyl pentapeptide phosphotransferase/UDP-N-acetylglucosamine-1-phosphate transferase n=1 Tax=Spirosoma taeanense TaxID=2735870 RepID=A0A6M5YCZ5_9BACT|nr:hypothetical protein [Spirosoma taeanense]QJW91163.1 hypothetical protein HNV11_18165 [Spirosoma taeanense]